MATYDILQMIQKALYTILKANYGDTENCQTMVQKWTDAMGRALDRRQDMINETMQNFRNLIGQIQQMQDLIQQSDVYMANRKSDIKLTLEHNKQVKQLTKLRTGIDLDIEDETPTYAPIPIASSTLVGDQLSGISDPGSLQWDEFEEFFMPPEAAELSSTDIGPPQRDDSVHASLQVHSPSRQGPVKIDVDVRPQPLVITEAGEEFVCDVTVNVQDESRQATTTHAFQTPGVMLPAQQEMNTTFDGPLNTTMDLPRASTPVQQILDTTFDGPLNTTMDLPRASTPVQQILDTTFDGPLNTTMDLPRASTPVQAILDTTYPGPLNTTMNLPRASTPVQQILNTTIDLPQSTVPLPRGRALRTARVPPRRRSPVHSSVRFSRNVEPVWNPPPAR